MALNTIGTAATNTLSGFVVGTNDLTPADVGSLRAGILNDGPQSGFGVVGPVGTGVIYPGAYAQQGLLFVPNRGVLKCLPGDMIAFDAATGWPILVSKLAAAGAGWVHVP